jgi:hypothetical protein
MNTAPPSSDSLLAVVESTSPLEAIIASIPQPENHLSVSVTPADKSPPGFVWYEIRSDNSNRIAAMAAIRQALTALIVAADDGQLAEFRIVHGAAFVEARKVGPFPRNGAMADGVALPA